MSKNVNKTITREIKGVYPVIPVSDCESVLLQALGEGDHQKQQADGRMNRIVK